MKKSDLIFYLLSLTLLVDSFNGYAIRTYDFSISPFYKSAILIACVIYTRAHIKVLTMAIVFLAGTLIHGAQGATINEFISEIQWILKALSIYIFFIFMSADTTKGRVDRVVIVARASFLIIMGNIILGAAGFGYSQYITEGYTLGTRGFFYAGNELAVALTCSAGILMVDALVNNRLKQYLVIFLISITMASLTAMKTSLLAISITFILLPFYENKISFSAYKTIPKIAALILTPTALSISLYYFIYHTELFSRFAYFYEKNGLLTLIFSYRNIWAIESLRIAEGYNISEILFGTGLSWITKMEHGGIVEIDPIDTFMTFGVVGLFVISGFLLHILKTSLSNRNQPYVKSGMILTLILISISFTAGHVVFSGIAAPLIAAVLSYSHHKISREQTNSPSLS